MLSRIKTHTPETIIGLLHLIYLLTCEGLESTKEPQAFSVFEETFKEYGMPCTIRTDNGLPFASPNAFGLSKLSVWWLLPDIDYPYADRIITVSTCGRICIGKRKINLSTVFSGQKVGIREVEDKIWLVSFMKYDIGFFDEMENRVEPATNPFDVIVLPMCPEWTSKKMVPLKGFEPPTHALRMRCSTTELQRLTKFPPTCI